MDVQYRKSFLRDLTKLKKHPVYNKIFTLAFQTLPGARPQRFDLAGVESLPSVEIDYAFAGSEGAGVRSARERGAGGVVVAAFGSGRVSSGQADEIRKALEDGMAVVLSSRVPKGSVRDEYGGGLGAGGRSVLFARDLNPQKARVLLMVALTRTRSPDALAEIFGVY